MTKLISQERALGRLGELRDRFRAQISEGYEHRAKKCSTCETPGDCCLDEHFVNVHISRLETVAIRKILERLPVILQEKVARRADEAIEKFSLTGDGDTYSKTYACPLYEKHIGCLVHLDGKPLPCIQHACYENEADLPPDDLLTDAEAKVDLLNRRTYGSSLPLLPIPMALRGINGRIFPPKQIS